MRQAAVESGGRLSEWKNFRALTPVGDRKLVHEYKSPFRCVASFFRVLGGEWRGTTLCVRHTHTSARACYVGNCALGET